MYNVQFAEIEGRKIPMKMTIRATEKIKQWHGDIEEWIKDIDGSRGIDRLMNACISGVIALGESGAAYLDMMREPHSELYSKQELELFVDPPLCTSVLIPVLIACINESTKRTVDIDEEPSKNEEPALEN